MDRSFSAAAGLVTFAGGFASLFFPAGVLGQTSGQVAGQTPAPANVPSVRRVQVLPAKGAVEVEIEGSDRLVPQIQVLTGPDRLVVDFPNAVPGSQLRNQNVNRGEVKAVRVGLFAAKPPVTRIVLDLTGPQPYQVFPYGRTVMVKVGGEAGAKAAQLNSGKQPVLVHASLALQPLDDAAPPAPAKPPLQVLFQDGELSIHSDKASLSEILFAVHERTGADIAIPAGAEQEKVAADLGPGPAPEVLSHLLNGSRFNFLILSAQGDPRTLDRVILSPRAEGGVGAPLAQMPVRQPTPVQNEAEEEAQPQPPAESIQPAPPAPPPGRQVPPTPPDTKPQENNEVPD
jgi:AMIN domain